MVAQPGLDQPLLVPGHRVIGNHRHGVIQQRQRPAQSVREIGPGKPPGFFEHTIGLDFGDDEIGAGAVRVGGEDGVEQCFIILPGGAAGIGPQGIAAQDKEQDRPHQPGPAQQRLPW